MVLLFANRQKMGVTLILNEVRVRARSYVIKAVLVLCSSTHHIKDIHASTVDKLV